jgi:outer membrane protein TolC
VVGYANANLYKGNSPLEEMAPEWMVGVSMKFDIFAKKDRSKEIEAAKLLHSKVESLKAQAQDDLKLGIEKTYNEMKLYRDEYNSLSSSIQLAQENYKLRSISFREGLSTSVEVVDAQLFLSGAKTKRLNAAYNYIKKLAFLSVLSGDRDSFFKFERLSRGIR